MDGSHAIYASPIALIPNIARLKGQRFNKIAIEEIAADKEAFGLSRVHMYESKCSLPLRDNCL